MKKNEIIGSLIWLVLYLGFLIPSYWVADRVGRSLLLQENYFVVLSPIVLVLLIFLTERFVPFKKDWNAIDMQTLNHVLYWFSSTCADTAGKSISLLVAPLIVSTFTNQEALRLWPISTPVFIQVVMGILIYDFVYYWYHRISHNKVVIWRLHRLHHSAEKLNGLALARFNMLDLLFELVLLTTVMVVLGVSENVSMKMAAFMVPATILSHANFSGKLPKVIGWLIITPNSHRIHHSSNTELLNKNFGGFTHLWDVVFGTYIEASKMSVQKVGITNHKTSKWFWKQHLDFLSD